MIRTLTTYAAAAFVAAVFLLLSNVAHANTYGLHVGSHHFPNEGRNNFNPGAYVKFDNGATFGGYRNTINKATFYAGYSVEFGPLGVSLLAATGYKELTGYTITPMIVPSLKLPSVWGVSPRLSYIPKAEKAKSHVLHLSIEF